MDSLLQEDIQFDNTMNPAPEITEESTKTLEERIKQRVADEAWDDVERKEDPKNLAAYKPRNDVELDSEKSKAGLGDVYEENYLKDASGRKATAAEEKMEAAHTEISELIGTLFVKLDALCNSHYTPAAVEADVAIVTKAPAISLEEATPAATSTATLVAPEELHQKPKGDVKAATEETFTDKKRQRRAKKKLKHLDRLDREAGQKAKEKADPSGQSTSKKEAMAKLKGAKNTTIIGDGTSTKSSSKQFFSQLAALTSDAPAAPSAVGGGKKKRKVAAAGSKLRL